MLAHPQEALDEELEALFGTSDINSGKTLTLTEFLGCLKSCQLQQLKSRPTMLKLKQPGGGGGPHPTPDQHAGGRGRPAAAGASRA